MCKTFGNTHFGRAWKIPVLAKILHIPPKIGSSERTKGYFSEKTTNAKRENGVMTEYE
jgi:hypothetical protein